MPRNGRCRGCCVDGWLKKSINLFCPLIVVVFSDPPIDTYPAQSPIRPDPDSPRVARSPNSFSDSRADSVQGRLAAVPPRSSGRKVRSHTSNEDINHPLTHSTGLEPLPHRHRQLGRRTTSDMVDAFCQVLLPTLFGAVASSSTCVGSWVSVPRRIR